MNPLLNLWLRMERGYGGRIGEQAVRATPALRGRSDMEIQEIVAQFVKAAAEDPSHLEQFGIDPGEAIKNATESLTQAFYKVSEKMYQQTGAQGGQPGPDMGGANFGGQQPGGQSAGNGGNDDVVDADYTVVDDQ